MIVDGAGSIESALDESVKLRGRSTRSKQENNVPDGDSSKEQEQKKDNRKYKQFASICPGPETPLPDDLGDILTRLQGALDMPVWLLIQRHHNGQFGHIDDSVQKEFMAYRKELRSCNNLALIIDSPGGYANSAYVTG